VAERLLLQFQEHPQAWQRVDAILASAQSQSTKYFALQVTVPRCRGGEQPGARERRGTRSPIWNDLALTSAVGYAAARPTQILESVVRFKWGALPVEQREGIKNFLSNLIIRFSGEEAVFRKESTFVNKLNVILVQVLKHDWPHKWQSFIPDIVAASKTSETLCENSMKILRLLSEEVFDFARVDLTQAKTKELKASLNNEFRLIHELCVFVLMNTRKPDLVRTTLDTLNVYLTWVPLGYIFESNLLEILLQLFPQPAFRNVALQCLTEVRPGGRGVCGVGWGGGGAGPDRAELGKAEGDSTGCAARVGSLGGCRGAERGAQRGTRGGVAQRGVERRGMEPRHGALLRRGGGSAGVARRERGEERSRRPTAASSHGGDSTQHTAHNTRRTAYSIRDGGSGGCPPRRRQHTWGTRAPVKVGQQRWRWQARWRPRGGGRGSNHGGGGWAVGCPRRCRWRPVGCMRAVGRQAAEGAGRFRRQGGGRGAAGSGWDGGLPPAGGGCGSAPGGVRLCPRRRGCVGWCSALLRRAGRGWDGAGF
jgi:hypothetical protein